jgi:hypothetical protein
MNGEQLPTCFNFPRQTHFICRTLAQDSLTSELKAEGTQSLEYEGKHVSRNGCNTAADQHATDRAMKAIIQGAVE